MNNITLKENTWYEIFPADSMFSSVIFVLKICRVKRWFREVDAILYDQFEGHCYGTNEIMTVKKFHKIAIREIIKK